VALFFPKTAAISSKLKSRTSLTAGPDFRLSA
jgi:hypothetical protein